MRSLAWAAVLGTFFPFLKYEYMYMNLRIHVFFLKEVLNNICHLAICSYSMVFKQVYTFIEAIQTLNKQINKRNDKARA